MAMKSKMKRSNGSWRRRRRKAHLYRKYLRKWRKWLAAALARKRGTGGNIAAGGNGAYRKAKWHAAAARHEAWLAGMLAAAKYQAWHEMKAVA